MILSKLVEQISFSCLGLSTLSAWFFHSSHIPDILVSFTGSFSAIFFLFMFEFRANHCPQTIVQVDFTLNFVDTTANMHGKFTVLFWNSLME